MALTWPVFIDRCLGGRAMAQELRRDGWLVSTHDTEFEQTTDDTMWLPTVSARGAVILTRDKRIRSRPDERAALLLVGARVVFVGFEGSTRTYLSALRDAEGALQRTFDT